ncbi:MAG: hypothetical protein A2Y03_02075 [Omnitrophica WOR_2 bacterium GWF2_38_59]|nr:MAG: hypothetical protein A2Y03_02075 [Omnitrophica WOR_2 bacterium GWF2_38_59]OGX47767.1 MAG: hypothetical protein A2243_00490 [Omnitrophica WOR_2 bacterium RIFOXYA2_FULL_38_17]OGX51167.1 MAG: hypothetical protein A2267_05395 [Omnitrophica WOR_2 bacterium RIFOXYA12_FULL_38_10]OGX56018.1 MAG: hypothetical protein A2306_00145 [Omnitrophica WOR_2 bacterium RIFOXYB2_FULL_38_16]OGX57704.1 MAG: hypothetical protein A2447_06350 [Omnitrophica WOR_2 bacterium RIFOXYC2_FULL_38_12]HBG60351.1 hypothet
MQKKSFVSGLTTCNGFVFLPVLYSGISSSLSLCMLIALLFFVMYLSCVGTTKEKIFLVGLVYLISFARMNYLLALGLMDIFYSFMDVDRILRIMYLVLAFGMIALGLKMFFEWIAFKRQASEVKVALRLPAFLLEQTPLAASKKTTFIDVFLNLIFLVFVPVVIGHFIGFLNLGSGENAELALNFLTVAQMEDIKTAYFKLFLYFISNMLPLILIWVFVMFSMESKGAANALRKHFSLLHMVFTAVLLAVGVSSVLVILNKLL